MDCPPPRGPTADVAVTACVDVAVTVLWEAMGVPEEPSPTGICIIRVEARNGGLLVALRTNPDIEHVSTEQVHHLVDIESTLRAVRQFLAAFAAGV